MENANLSQSRPVTSNRDGLLLAHLSDVHLSPVPLLDWRHANIKRVLGFLNWQWKRRRWHSNDVVAALLADLEAMGPDHIAVSGDLVNIALPKEFAAAERWLSGVGLPRHVSVVPGNHDLYTELNGDVGVARWAAYMAGDGDRLVDADGDGGPDVSQRQVLDGFPYLRVRGGVALIGVNSAYPTPPFNATGVVESDELDRLKSLLLDCRDRGLFRCVMIHHPPLPGQASLRRGLTNAEALKDLFAQTGVDLVLHGHNHQNSFVWGDIAGAAAGEPSRYPVIGVASASSVHSKDHDPMGGPALARYNLIQIQRSMLGGTWDIEVTGRGLSHRHGSVRELERFAISNGVRTDVGLDKAQAS
ncbi:MAG: metallophosphoesterase [Pseudomonadota bacterium]